MAKRIPTRGRSHALHAWLCAAAVVAGCGKSPASPTPTPTLPAPPSGATAAMVAEGQTLYRQGSCTLCHGFSGTGGAGPNLTDSIFLHNSGSFEEIIAIIDSGVPVEKFKSPNTPANFFMLPRGAMVISDAQLRSLAAYVWTLSHPNG